MTTIYTKRPQRRNEKPQAPRHDQRHAPLLDTAAQLTVGGRLVHRRTHRCVAFCNAVAALAGIGQAECA